MMSDEEKLANFHNAMAEYEFTRPDEDIVAEIIAEGLDPVEEKERMRQIMKSAKESIGMQSVGVPPITKPERLTKEGLRAYFIDFLGGERGEASADVLSDVCLLVQSETERRLASD
jgi:hypothetical protein